jgi:HlyD family secretion protein
MTAVVSTRRLLLLGATGTITALSLIAGCTQPDPQRIQGYVEGEFVYVASPRAAALKTLHVRRGAQVKTGDPLFALEDAPEQAARDEAQRRLAQARAILEDATKGQRPSELEAIEAKLGEARAAHVPAERELLRLERLDASGAASPAELDRARSQREQAAAQVAQLEAELKTARLGARPDQIRAAEAEVQAREAALAQAEWNLAQQRQAAPQTGLVFDTLFQEGEWVPAGRPVVALLPPAHVKVRAFVPETQLAALQIGDAVRVTADGVAQQFVGSVAFISPRAEFTPPVIYSRESRSKLVFLIEVVFDPEAAATLHPGQPVDVAFEH